MTATPLHTVMTASAAQGAIMDRHAELQRVLDEWAAVHAAKENYLLLPALARSRNGLTVLASREPALVSSC